MKLSNEESGDGKQNGGCPDVGVESDWGRAQGIIWRDGCVLCLDRDTGYMGKSICQNLLIGTFYCR